MDRLLDMVHADLPSASGMPKVGAAIRRLRLARSMTLQELGDASGVSVGMLSQIERDRANPSLRVLSQIRDALDAPISALFEDGEAASIDPSFVCRADARPRLQLGYLDKELLSQPRSGGLQLVILNIPPFGGSGEQPIVSSVEKGGMVLEGVLDLTVGQESAVLHEGDSFLFNGALPHRLQNPAERAARILWVVGAPAVEPLL